MLLRARKSRAALPMKICRLGVIWQLSNLLRGNRELTREEPRALRNPARLTRLIARVVRPFDRREAIKVARLARFVHVLLAQHNVSDHCA